jgi:tripartite-type tricarboxylate transporter receptor subunit TctC
MRQFSTAVARILFAGALIALTPAATAQQQPYPSKPIRFISPYAPGGATSILGRLVGQRLTESWGQPVVLDNRPGGNGVISAEALLKSQPDGYTILLISGSAHLVAPLLIQNFPYDPINSFAPVATLASGEIVLLLHPSVPASTLREFIALAKASPGQLNYSTAGNGGMSHLAAELFSSLAGTKMQAVAYKGSTPAVTDLIGGQVQLSFQNPFSLIPQIRSGRLKAIAITGETRASALPTVPTFTEAGLPSMDVKLWYGILAPAATPKQIINKLSAEIAKILAMPDTKDKLGSQGMEPFVSTPEQFDALMRADTAQYARIIKSANIKIED